MVGGRSTLDSDAERLTLERRLNALPTGAGALEIVGHAWAWSLPLRSPSGLMGHLVVAASQPPSSDQVLLLRSLAQQAGIAVDNARRHTHQQRTNAELARTVQELRNKTAIHDRFTQVAVSGAGRDGIATALSELTGFAVSIENREGTVLAWADPAGGPVDPWIPTGRRVRSSLLDEAHRVGHSIRFGDRLVTVARPRADVVGVITLIDPDQRAGEPESVALEHAGTVLAVELARLHSLAETELRLGSDLLAELLTGADLAAQRRAQALGHDLHQPHRVVILTRTNALERI